ncbi:hypothetical protein FRC12_001907 [Ceratobasidium sp. 428]|nr:hypothetical protein FRC12_001907 [Ceratobasidium sp. 428]
MMEPTLPSYVGNLTSRVVRYMQQHPGSFGIPDSLVSVPGSGIWSRRFSRAVGRTFTVFRSETLKKVSLSLVPGAAKRDIAALAKYIAPANFITGKSHWTRVAFIRAYVVAWLADGKPKPFWKYLDEKRDKLAERDDPTAFLTQVFKKDQETYPAPRLKGKRGIHGAGILPQRMAMPVWQRGTKEIVETIENYEPDELDPKIPVDDVHDEEVNGGDEGPGDEQPGDEDEDGEGNKGGEDNEGGEGGNKAGEKENE